MTQNKVLQVFRDTGALLEGHFVLRSGLRSRHFFQCALALQHMPTVEKLGAALADKVRSLKPATVIAPAMGGLVIGQEVARQLGVRFLFTEKEEGLLVLRRGFKIAPGEKVLIVEDERALALAQNNPDLSTALRTQLASYTSTPH